MKKSFTTSYVLTALLLVTLADCGTPESTQQNNQTKQEGTQKMTRQKTSSGLEYETLQEGAGASPEKGKQVTVHYTGWLEENDKPGQKFDSSVDRGQPFTFIIGVGQVIKGWDEGVLSMKVGEKRRLIIPASLGYGAYGVPGAIPANATLIFDVELLDVEK